LKRAALFQRLPRDGIHYITLTLVILLSALLLTVGLAKFFNLGPAWPPAFWQVPHLHAGPVGALGRPAKRIAQPAPPDRHAVGARQHGTGYALTYLVGLVGLMLVVRHLPSWLGWISTPRPRRSPASGGSPTASRKTYLPIIRAYRVGPELAAWIGGRTLRETGIYPHRLLCGAHSPQRHSGQPRW
jgi:putative transport protein